ARCAGEVRKRPELGSVEELARNRTKALARFDIPYYYESWADEARTVAAIRNRAVSIVAAVWHDSSETRAWLKACAQSDENEDVRTSAVEALARGWKDDRETF